MNSIIGKKLGMTRIFDESGKDRPVTVIAAGPCTVSQVKTEERDGYQAVQLAFGERKASSTNKPLLGHFQKAGIKPARVIKEFRTTADHKPGDVISVDIFAVGDSVKVKGVSKGRGFTGVMKRHGFHGGRASHGKSNQLRAGGSVGASSDPSRVFPGKRMPGQSGNVRRSVTNLKVVKVDPEKNQLFVLGAVPGPRNGTVYLTKQS
ncbi:MAG: 50S ribosomal protein L3 [Candidatus Marinimicrobia bacterium]|nr:50S ribosomal protein L3 [Candidatus Neomarinimicrobiota bacterium]